MFLIKDFFSFVLCLVLLLAAVDWVSACTCQPIPPSCALYNHADAVFTGKIMNITSAMNENIGGVSMNNVNSISSWGASGLIAILFKVETAFKGISGETIKIITYKGTTCDLRVKKGQRWIIYATRDQESGVLTFGACGGNRQIDKIDEDVTFLDKYAKGEVKPLIVGNVAKDFMPSNESVNALITIEGNGLNLSNQTLIGGPYRDSEFKFELPQSGKYNVKVSMPFSATFFPNVEPSVKVFPTENETVFTYEADVAGNRCDYKNISVVPLDLKATAEIRGRIVDNSGQTVSDNYAPNLCRVKETEEKTLETCHSYGNYDKGNFSFIGLREGEYVVVLNPRNVPTLDEHFVRTYLPGTKDFSQAQRITLEQGAKIESLVFNQPESLRQTNITGELLLKNGKPVTEFITRKPEDALTFNLYNGIKGTDLSYFCHSRPGQYSCGIEPETVDKDGHFSFRAFIGYKYVLAVKAENDKGKERTGFVSFEAEENMKPFKLILDSDGEEKLEETLQTLKQSKLK